MSVSARIYNWRELNKGRAYAECLVLEGTPRLCAAYLNQHDPEGEYLCFEQAQLGEVVRERTLSVAERIPHPNWPNPTYVRSFRADFEAAHASI